MCHGALQTVRPFHRVHSMRGPRDPIEARGSGTPAAECRRAVLMKARILEFFI